MGKNTRNLTKEENEIAYFLSLDSVNWNMIMRMWSRRPRFSTSATSRSSLRCFVLSE